MYLLHLGVENATIYNFTLFKYIFNIHNYNIIWVLYIYNCAYANNKSINCVKEFNNNFNSSFYLLPTAYYSVV